jgi:Uma2 family endonuclease
MSYQPSADRRYTYADYCTWSDDERWEFIDGIPYAMSLAPTPRHQDVVGEIFRQAANHSDGQQCRPYIVPLDVRLPVVGEPDEKVRNVVQPDVIVVCDRHKIDDKGCRGAPDGVVEVLSPGTAAKDQIQKAALYERHGVREYWTVHPIDRIVTVRTLGSDGHYGLPIIHEGKGTLPVCVLSGLAIDLDRVFA